LAAIFGVCYGSEKSLSIHSIRTRRREIFYWAAVMATFALGTAAGDMTAVTLHLGYLASGVMFFVVIAIPALAHWRFGINPILAFWFAYIATRPLGASFADWMGVSHARSGLDLGPGPGQHRPGNPDHRIRHISEPHPNMPGRPNRQAGLESPRHQSKS
jgi:uncharacterized membrane-anchored protein